jgi:hypothetical protein
MAGGSHAKRQGLVVGERHRDDMASVISDKDSGSHHFQLP